MDWFPGLGLLIGGITLLAVYYFTSGKGREGRRPSGAGGNGTGGEPDRVSGGQEIRKHLREGSLEAADRLVQNMDAEALFLAMADRSESVRHAAAAALVKLGDASIAPALVKALYEPAKWLPARVAEVLTALGKEALPALHEAFADQDPVVRGYIIEILGEIGDRSSAEVLHGVLADEHSDIRFQAARALGRIGLEASAGRLIGLLEDPEIKVRVQAVRSLGLIGGQEAARQLSLLANSPEPAVSFAAGEALNKMAAAKSGGPSGTSVNIVIGHNRKPM